MELLDTRTLLLTITVLLVARAAALAYVWRVVRHYAPTAYWTAGSILVAVGSLLVGLREIAPAGVSIILAQTCIIFGWLLVDGGIIVATGRKIPWRPAIALLLAFLPALAWFTYASPDYVVRTVVTSVPVIAVDLYAMFACLRARSGRRVVTLRILAAALAVMVVSNVWKMLGAATLQSTSLFQPSPPLIQFLVISMMYFIASTAIFILLAAQQLQEELDAELSVRRQAEAELKRHQEHLESLVHERTVELEERNAQLGQTQFAMDRVGIGVAWNELETGRFLYVNNETCRQLGYSRDELLALDIDAINPAVTPAVLAQITTRLRAGDGRLRQESRHHRKDGSTYPVEITAYLHRADGREWFISFYNDISARKAAEADLITAKEAAESASRAKSAFLANMSHELRTPMNGIMGMNYLARHQTTDEKLRQYLDEVDIAAKHLLQIINDVLDIAQFESDRLELVPVAFCLPEVLERTDRLVAAEIAEKGLTLVIDLPPDLASVTLRGDAQRVGQILNCLVGNAVKFTPKGTVSLTVRAKDHGDGTLMLRFDVVDTGIGIAVEDQRRLFAAFEQVDMSHTRKYGGIGLGLVISKRLAQLLGGDIGVSSQPGAGSHFWFTVRLERG